MKSDCAYPPSTLCSNLSARPSKGVQLIVSCCGVCFKPTHNTTNTPYLLHMCCADQRHIGCTQGWFALSCKLQLILPLHFSWYNECSFSTKCDTAPLLYYTEHWLSMSALLHAQSVVSSQTWLRMAVYASVVGCHSSTVWGSLSFTQVHEWIMWINNSFLFVCISFNFLDKFAMSFFSMLEKLVFDISYMYV